MASMLRFLLEASRQEALKLQQELIDLLPDDIDVDLNGDSLTSTYHVIWVQVRKGTRSMAIKWVSKDQPRASFSHCVFTVVRDYEVGRLGNDGSPFSGTSIQGLKQLTDFILDELED